MKTLEILDALIGFDTVSHKSNLDLVAYVEALLRAADFRVTRLASPCGTKAGLYAEIGPEVDGGLLLSAHTDVVPVEGQVWTKDPFKLTRDGQRLRQGLWLPFSNMLLHSRITQTLDKLFEHHFDTIFAITGPRHPNYGVSKRLQWLIVTLHSTS